MDELHDIPADIVALRVTLPGFSEQFKNNSTEKLSTTPLRTRKVPCDATDLAGMKKGRLTVIGMYGGPEVGIERNPMKTKNKKKPGGHGWVCRCVCGNYTVRKTKSLKKNNFDCCLECRHFLYLTSMKGKCNRATIYDETKTTRN